MSAAASQFVFRAMRPDGATRLGVRAAADEAALAMALRRDDLLLLRAWRLPVRASETRLPLGDEAALNGQLATLLSRGVTLVEALEVCASVVSKPTKPIVERLRERVAAGASFAEACEREGCFESATIAVYRSAERSGDLGGAAERLAESARGRKAIAGKAVTVMIYPSIVGVIAVLIMYGLLTFLVPMISEQIENLGSEVPGFSRAVFALGNWMNAHAVEVAAGAGLVVVLGLIFRRVVAARFMALGRGLPGVRPLLISTELARFFSVRGAMTRTGVPLADALGAATGTIGNPRLRGQLEDLRRRLVEGGVWRVLMQDVTALPLATRRLLIAAERGGDLDSAFDALAGDMSAEVETRSQRLLALLEPLVIVVLFALIGPLVLAIAIPLMTYRSGGVA